MTLYTVHVRANAFPRLIPERFAWGAVIFGPVWLLFHGAWIAAAVGLLVSLATGLLTDADRAVAGIVIAIAFGLFGHDLRRHALARRGFALRHVVQGRTQDEALARLLDATPDLREAAAK